MAGCCSRWPPAGSRTRDEHIPPPTAPKPPCKAPHELKACTMHQDRGPGASGSGGCGAHKHGNVQHERGPGGGRGVSGFLALEDGTVFPGQSVGAAGTAVGEAVFTTAMTGYQEVATDPSFCGQVVCFTAPMVGNYGVAETRSESASAHA